MSEKELSKTEEFKQKQMPLMKFSLVLLLACSLSHSLSYCVHKYKCLFLKSSYCW